MRRMASCTAAVTALTTALVVVTAGTAAADEVVAYGHRVGGVCHFEETIDYVGVAMRADEECRLLRVPQASWGTLRSPGTRRPKTVGSTATAVVPGLPGGVLTMAGSTVSTLTEAVDGSTFFHGVARWTYRDRDDVVVIDDVLEVYYRQTEQDGTFDGVTPGAGHCETGPMAFPETLTIEDCWWQPGILGGHTVSFSSGGTYVYRLLLAELRLRLHMNYVHTSDGQLQRHCSGPSWIPVGWSTTGCQVGNEIVEGP